MPSSARQGTSSAACKKVKLRLNCRRYVERGISGGFMSSGTMRLKMAAPAPKLACSSHLSCKAKSRPVCFEEPSSPHLDSRLPPRYRLSRVSSRHERHSDPAHHTVPIRVRSL